MDQHKPFRCLLFNVENLFLYMDAFKGQNLEALNEIEWQKLSLASVANKELRKCFSIADLILSHKADLVLLCEVGGFDSLNNFNKYFLGDIYKPLLIEGNSDRGIDVGYLVRRRLPFSYELLTHKERPIQFLYPFEKNANEMKRRAGQAILKKSHFFSRDVAELRVHWNDDDSPKMIFLLAHLKSKLDPKGIDPAGRLRRAAELRTLVTIYNERRQEFPDIPICVAGDMNGRAAKKNPDPEFRLLHEQTDLIDVFDLANIPDSDRYSQVQFSTWDKKQNIQIDYAFVSPEAANHLIGADTRMLPYRDGSGSEVRNIPSLQARMALPSDHFPLMFCFDSKLFS